MTSELEDGSMPSWGLALEPSSTSDIRKPRTRKPHQTFRRENYDADDVVSEVTDCDKIEALLTADDQEHIQPGPTSFINLPGPNLFDSHSAESQRINNPNRYLTKPTIERNAKKLGQIYKWNGIKHNEIREPYKSEKIHADGETLSGSEMERVEYRRNDIADTELNTDIKTEESIDSVGNHAYNRLDRQCKLNYPIPSVDMDDSDESFELAPEDDMEGNYEDEEYSNVVNYSRVNNNSNIDSEAGVTSADGDIQGTVSCKLCEFKFASRSKLRTHMKKHAIRTISCPECQIFFTSQGALLWHARFVHTTRKYDHECEVCGVTVRLKQDLMSHYMTHRLAKGVARCAECSRSFKNTVLLKLHQLTMCTKIPEVDSSTIGSTLHNDNFQPSVDNDNAEHELTTTKDISPSKHDGSSSEEGPSTDVTSLALLGNNSSTVGLEEIVTFYCPYCPATFHSKGMYTIHTKKHTKPHACDICGRGFAKNFTLLCHRKTHLNQKDFRCELCGQAFTLRPQLTKHRADNHAPEHKLVCHRCNSRFKHISMLRRHESYYCRFLTSNTEDGISNADLVTASVGVTSSIPASTTAGEHPCPHCDKVLDCVWALEQHVKYHRRKFTCHICGNKFGERFHLQSHLLTHLGVRPFKCTVCGVTFPMKAHCKRHCLMHTRPQTYECFVCGYMFRQDEERRVHVRDGWCLGRRHDKQDLRVMVAFEKPDLGSLGITSSMLGYALSPSEQTAPPPGAEVRPAIIDESTTTAQQCSPGATIKKEPEEGEGEVIGDTSAATGKTVYYPCTLCTKKCTKRAHLVVHMARAHSIGAAPFRCCVCGHGAAFERTMRLHLESHIPYRRYSCRVCNARFSNERGLASHKTGEKCGRRKPVFVEAFDGDNENVVIEYVDEDLSMYNQMSISLSALKTERELATLNARSMISSDDTTNHHDSTEIKTELNDNAEYPENNYYENTIEEGDYDLGEEEEENESDEQTICDSDADRSDPETEINNDCGLDLTTRRRSVDLDNKVVDNGVVSGGEDWRTGSNRSKDNMNNSNRTLDNINGGGGRLVFTIKKEKNGTGYSIDNSVNSVREQPSGFNFDERGGDRNLPRDLMNTSKEFDDNFSNNEDDIDQVNTGETHAPKNPSIELPLCVRVLRDPAENERVLINGEDVVPWCERALRASRTASYGVGGENPRDFSARCPVCARTITGRYKYRVHMQRHSGDRPFVCTKCEKSFKTRESLRVHERWHDPKRVLTCDICGARCVSTADMRHHRTVHDDAKPYSCTTCGKAFRRKIYLNTHMRMHTGEMPFSCNVCDRRFRIPSSLNDHMKLHNGMKPYECSMCHKQFAQRANWRTHERRHRGIKKFSCEVCSKTFVANYELQNHRQRCVSNDLPYTCLLCGMKFTREHPLKRHIGRHCCKFCGQQFVDMKEKMSHQQKCRRSAIKSASAAQ